MGRNNIYEKMRGSLIKNALKVFIEPSQSRLLYRTNIFVQANNRFKSEAQQKQLDKLPYTNIEYQRIYYSTGITIYVTLISLKSTVNFNITK